LRSGFDPRIESLRGVAALSVVLTHSVAVLRIDGVAAYWTIPFWEQSPAAQATTLLGAIFNPGAAVVLFFVLSGYVLGLSLRREDGPLRDRLGTYLWRRGFRLLPAMWASILLYALVLQLIAFTAPRELFSDWYVAMFGALRGWHAMARNFVLVDSNANPVTWTMYVEVIGSLAVPLLYAWHRGRTAAAGVLVLVVLIVVAALWPSSVTLRYLFCFDIGVMLACHPGLARAVPRPGLALGAAMLLFATDRLALAPYPRLDLFADALGSTLLLAARARPAAFPGPHFLQPLSVPSPRPLSGRAAGGDAAPSRGPRQRAGGRRRHRDLHRAGGGDLRADRGPDDPARALPAGAPSGARWCGDGPLKFVPASCGGLVPADLQPPHLCPARTDGATTLSFAH
jgi:peptidoglycan/LPS O-acetylase OafA/YrhL